LEREKVFIADADASHVVQVKVQHTGKKRRMRDMRKAAVYFGVCDTKFLLARGAGKFIT